MPALTPELDHLVMQWNNRAPSYDSWPNDLPIIGIHEITKPRATFSWGYQAGLISIARNVNTRNITVANEELAQMLPGISTIHRVYITRPLPIGTSVIVPSNNLIVLRSPDDSGRFLWVCELGCSHMNTDITTIGNLVETYKCVDCGFEYEVDHGD